MYVLVTPASSPFLICSAGKSLADVLEWTNWGALLHNLKVVEELWLGAAVDGRHSSWDAWWIAVWIGCAFRGREEEQFFFCPEMAVYNAIRCVLYSFFAKMKCLLFAAKPSRVVIE